MLKCAERDFGWFGSSPEYRWCTKKKRKKKPQNNYKTSMAKQGKSGKPDYFNFY